MPDRTGDSRGPFRGAFRGAFLEGEAVKRATKAIAIGAGVAAAGTAIVWLLRPDIFDREIAQRFSNLAAGYGFAANDEAAVKHPEAFVTGPYGVERKKPAVPR